MDELITRVESVMHVFHRLIGIMDDVAECDITVHMQDAAVLDQHATKVVTASLLLEELDSLLPHGSIYGHQNTPIDTSKSAQGVLDLDIVKPYVSQIHPMKQRFVSKSKTCSYVDCEISRLVCLVLRCKRHAP